MTTPLRPTPERDLREPVHAEIRALLVATVEGRDRRAAHQRQGRLVPLLAAAALTAVVAVTAVVGGLTRGPSQPAGSATPTGTATLGPGRVLDDATLVQRCVAQVTADHPNFTAVSRGAQMHVVFTDILGYTAWVGTTRLDAVCEFRWDGTLDHTRGSAHPAVALGFLANPRALQGDALTTADQVTVYGRVGRDVRRVVLQVPGQPAVEAALHGQFFQARVVGLAPLAASTARREFTVTAYDADGAVLRRANQNQLLDPCQGNCFTPAAETGTPAGPVPAGRSPPYPADQSSPAARPSPTPSSTPGPSPSGSPQPSASTTPTDTSTPSPSPSLSPVTPSGITPVA